MGNVMSVEHAELSNPLKIEVFQKLWIANFFSNIGFWVQSVATAWLMTQINHSIFYNSMLQVATTGPFFLFSLIAGLLADHYPRNILLILFQTLRSILAITLAILVFYHWINPDLLLLMTFLLSTINAFNMPTWQSSISLIVPKKILPMAASLNNLNFNLARSIGGALTGFLIPVIGESVIFLINGVSNIFLIKTFFKYSKNLQSSPENKIKKDMIGGVQALRKTPKYYFLSFPSYIISQYKALLKTVDYHKVLILAALCFFFSSSIWSLMAIYAQRILNFASKGFGFLVGLMGVGSILAAFLLAKQTARISKLSKQQSIINQNSKKNERINILSLNLMVNSLCLLYLFFVNIHHSIYLDIGIYVSFILLGCAWAIYVSLFNYFSQALTHGSLRGKSSAMLMMVFYGGMTLGGFFWGFIADRFSIPLAFAYSGLGLLLLGFFLQNKSFTLKIDDYH